MLKNNRILWVDDEVELLRSHILFLNEKGYEVCTVNNGADALEEIKVNNFDLILLDEMMAGMGGLETLSKIREMDQNTPVVMITKNEEESLMNDALGAKINDYLIKPIVPSQVFLVCKKLLEGKKIYDQYAAKDYLSDFNKISVQLIEKLDWNEWIEIYKKLIQWSITLDNVNEESLQQTLFEQIKECNIVFSKFIENNYQDWINSTSANRPLLSPDIFKEFVVPKLDDDSSPTFLFVLDCLRYDQWLKMEKILIDYFEIKHDFYYSILPTATPFSRNAIFSGMYPLDIKNKLPKYWCNISDEGSQNQYEKELLMENLKTNNVKLRTDLQYIKIINPNFGRNLEQNIHSYNNSHFIAIVVNFLDMIAHGRSDSQLLKEIAPDEAAYRSLTNSWFEHSSLLGTLKTISSMKNSKVIITTDHGSIRALRGTKVLGDRETSKNLRFKFGRNLKVDEKHAIMIKNPEDFKLPKSSIANSCIIAKEDFYFVYPNEYNRFLAKYKDTFQHGGVSMEEMILPVLTLRSKV